MLDRKKMHIFSVLEFYVAWLVGFSNIMPASGGHFSVKCQTETILGSENPYQLPCPFAVKRYCQQKLCVV